MPRDTSVSSVKALVCAVSFTSEHAAMTLSEVFRAAPLRCARRCARLGPDAVGGLQALCRRVREKVIRSTLLPSRNPSPSFIAHTAAL